MWHGGLHSWGAEVVACLLYVVVAAYLLSGATGWLLVGGGLVYGGLAIHFAVRARRTYRNQRASPPPPVSHDELR